MGTRPYTDEELMEELAKFRDWAPGGGNRDIVTKVIGQVAGLQARVKELEAGARPWNPASQPPSVRGMYEVTLDTDEGPEVLILEFNKDGHWIYEGEPTFCHPCYLSVVLWRDRAAPGKFEVEQDQ